MAPPSAAPAGAPTPASSSLAGPGAAWRNPPAAIQQKYNLKALGDDFQPTTQEVEVLQMYDTIKQYEKEAARIKEEAARRKLDEAALRYQEQQAKAEAAAAIAAAGSPKRETNIRPKRKKPKRRVSENGDELPDDDDYDDYGEDEDSMDDDQEAKLMEMREEVEEAKQKDEGAMQEAKRAELLKENDDDDMDMIGLKRKRLSQRDEGEPGSLIANMSHQVTPPHDFSQKLGLKSWEGKVLFPPPDAEVAHKWTPSEDSHMPTDGDMSFLLPEFNMEKPRGNNTLAIKYTAPSNSRRFSINIATSDQEGRYDSVLFHFNPRQFEKGGQLVLNNKAEGLWGQAINVPLSRVPKIFGEQSCTLVVQVSPDGFDVILNDKHCARLEHRSGMLQTESNLLVQFPATDDKGKSERWSVYKVWWGHKESLASPDLSDVYGVNAYSGLHPKKLFLKGLKRISSSAEVELRKAQLERAFRKYGGDLGVIVTAPQGVTFAFVECVSEQQTTLALEEMQDKYDIKRARRTRHEALQEERAAKEAAAAGAGGARGKGADWD